MKRLFLVLLVTGLGLILSACSKEYVVTFIDSEGQVIKTVEVSEEPKMSEPNIDNKEGYTFEGWYTSSDDGETFNERWSFSNDEVSSDTKLYANWTANQYEITYNIYEEYNPPYDIPLNQGETVTSLSLGNNHSAAITSEGRVFMWGRNNDLKLGDGTLFYRSIPTEITSRFDLEVGEEITSISLGGNHSSAITSDGRVFTWGRNNQGQLGDGTTTTRGRPIEITSQFMLEAGETVTSLSLGFDHSAAITSEGRVFTWGRNDVGTLGDGTTLNRFIPTDITDQLDLEAGEAVSKLSMGLLYSAAITSDGRVFVWGSYGASTLYSLSDILYPIEITRNFDLEVGEIILDISYGTFQASAITSEGRVFVWGLTFINETVIFSRNPEDITDQFDLAVGETITGITLGEFHCAVNTSEGRVFTWGDNQYGQLGDGTIEGTYISLPGIMTLRFVPNPIDITSQFDLNMGETILNVVFDGNRSAVITSKGRVFTWGDNEYGQLGDGTTNNQSAPSKSIFKVLYSDEIKVYEYQSNIEFYLPVREGYEFDGWYLDQKLTEEYVFTTMPAEDLTLYARWIEE